MQVNKLLPALLLTLALVLAGGAAAWAGGADSQPPVVVSTVPQAGDTAVDPGLQEIRVTFSKDMLTNKMWSWVKADQGAFPQITGPVRFLKDGRTCVAPVRLEPGKSYAIWFNRGRFNAFRDTGGRPAVPYLLVFETKK